MKKYFMRVATLMLMFGLVAFGQSYAGAVLQQKTKMMQQFVQFAASATISKEAKNSEVYQLQLNHVDSKTLWFADRPVRKAGWMPTSQFVEKWQARNHVKAKHEFVPNASLIGYDKAGHQVILVASLSQPIFTAANGQITYRIKFIYDENKKNSAIHLTKPVLFIDHICFLDC